MPVATRDRLRQRFLDRHADLVPPPPRGQTATGTGIHRPLVRSDERAIGYVPYRQGTLPDPLPATLVAFYLPQFHTIPENDEWWGKGFTEWRNVARALPQFEGHHQPRLPGDLGFYDLRNPEVMREQARLAREYGISAFCFYFYWFGGKTLLETPLRNWLDDKTIDLQFCLCWANEKWSRTWDGRGNEILIDQQHSPEDDIAFIAHVAEYMRDPRYLRVDGKPMLLVYRPGLFPDMRATAERWRTWCKANGVGDLHLVYVQGFERPEPFSIGFDAAVQFPPNMGKTHDITAHQLLLNPHYAGRVLDWRALVAEFRQLPSRDYLLYSCVNPGWDNEARRSGRGRTFLHSSPRAYGEWLENSIAAPSVTESRRTIFINAWNEWAEGATLEPDASLGYAYLEATRRALCSGGLSRPATRQRQHAIVHAWHVEVLDEIIALLHQSGMDWHLTVTTAPEKLDEVNRKVQVSGIPANVVALQNRGRDILPFLRIANQLLDEGVDVVLKLHTKRSEHRPDGDSWRKDLMGELVSKDRAHRIATAFAEQPELGLVGPGRHMLPTGSFIGANADQVSRLSRLMGSRETSYHDKVFVSGTMFWVRLRALGPLLDLPIRESDFEPESGQIDGTLAHAIERLIGMAIDETGFATKSAASICDQPEQTSPDYQYAQRTRSPPSQ
ncbi:glycoside hydrolase family 99-like domain-containing protein [Pseudoxanthomonas sp. 22568]|uniref:glycoside hydrolase family 99-like domain-containing protein n=1 Tax=Pseudoxanthomonas sp. 22568 TaxID=3453945 RepID=UPI003F87986A